MYQIFLPVIISIIQAVSVTTPDYTFRVVQQPAGELNWVSRDTDTLTQYQAAQRYGVMGIMAHSGTLPGLAIANLKPGDVVTVDIGGEKWQYVIEGLELYRVEGVQYWPIPMGDVMTSTQLFERMYVDPAPGYNRIVLQTCVEAGGFDTWGRLFVIGVKMNQIVITIEVPEQAEPEENSDLDAFAERYDRTLNELWQILYPGKENNWESPEQVVRAIKTRIASLEATNEILKKSWVIL